MPVDPQTQTALRALGAVGELHRRMPLPVPEADPWEDDDPLDGRRAWVPVEFPGIPSVIVRVHRDGQDVVIVEDTVELDVPRRHTAAVVDEILAGRARRRLRTRNFFGYLMGIFLHNPLPADLVVTVGRDGAGGPVRYEAPVVLTIATGGWLATLPTVDAAAEAVDGGTGGRPPGAGAG